jgi:acetyltransferase-like isoleucine patch superfamily enzyme
MIRAILSKLGGEGFGSKDFSVLLLLKCFVFQKILGFNRRVPWPVHWTSSIRPPSRIVRGTRCPGLSMGCHIDGRNGIKLGINVRIGPRVSIISMNHDQYNFDKYIECGPVVIGDNCWLATNSVILSGVELGAHTIVAAGSVVTKSFKEGNQVLTGIPARVVKQLESYRG